MSNSTTRNLRRRFWNSSFMMAIGQTLDRYSHALATIGACVLVLVVIPVFGTMVDMPSPIPGTGHVVTQSPVATPTPVASVPAPSDNIAPDKSYSGYQGPCEEDQPCWDCQTMGNRICGPVEPVSEPQTVSVAPSAYPAPVEPYRPLPAPTVAKPVVPAPVPVVSQPVVSRETVPTPVDCAHLKPGNAWAGVSLACPSPSTTAKPSPTVRPSCPPPLFNDGLFTAPPNAPKECVYAQ